MVTIKITDTALSDRSLVYDVAVIDADANQLFLFMCIDKKDAFSFAHGLEQLVERHTVMTPQIETRITETR